MTIFDINSFKATLTNGGARPNQFQCIIGFPSYVPSATREAAFLVSAAELPGSSVPPATIFYRGRAVHFAGDRQFNPWVATVLNDADFVVRTALEQWMNGMDSTLLKRGYTEPAAYLAGSMQVNQLDRNGEILKSYTMLDVFPTEVSAVGLDYSANDTISNFQVTFYYQSMFTSGVPASVV